MDISLIQVVSNQVSVMDSVLDTYARSLGLTSCDNVRFQRRKTQVEMSLILSTFIYCKSTSTLHEVWKPSDATRILIYHDV